MNTSQREQYRGTVHLFIGTGCTTGKHLIPVGQEPTGISLKPTGISTSRRFRAYSRRLSADRRQMSGIRLFPSAANGNN
jgi:hypothetical protein